jgi:hypothetical protein
VSTLNPSHFQTLYAEFDSPVTALDCGAKCAPHNAYGVPFCCDTRHAVPTAYLPEWNYLQTNTDLWHIWEAEDKDDTTRLRTQVPDEQVAIQCLGHPNCQRPFRSITCRAFPFFPYITTQGDFIGLSYYWEYEDRCWVISNLGRVTHSFRTEFATLYELIFEKFPGEKDNFHYHSMLMRRVFGQKKRAIPLLHRNGKTYTITPENERMRRVAPESLPKFDPYDVTALLQFPDEIET